MGIITAWLSGAEAEDAMVRANKRPLDTAKIDALVQQLKLSVRDAEAFNSVYTSITDDRTLTAGEVIEIAFGFLGGHRPKGKTAALAAIGQERVRIAHAKAKGDSAAKARVW